MAVMHPAARWSQEKAVEVFNHLIGWDQPHYS